MKGFGRWLSWPNPGTLSICMGLWKTKKKLGQDNRRLGRDSKEHLDMTLQQPARCWHKIVVKCAAIVMQPCMTSTVTLGPLRMRDFVLTIKLISVKFALTWRSRCQWLQHNLHFILKVLFSYAYKINYGQTKNSVPKPEKTSTLQKPPGRSGYPFLPTQLLVT